MTAKLQTRPTPHVAVVARDTGLAVRVCADGPGAIRGGAPLNGRQAVHEGGRRNGPELVGQPWTDGSHKLWGDEDGAAKRGT